MRDQGQDLGAMVVEGIALRLSKPSALLSFYMAFGNEVDMFHDIHIPIFT